MIAAMNFQRPTVNFKTIRVQRCLCHLTLSFLAIKRSNLPNDSISPSSAPKGKDKRNGRISGRNEDNDLMAGKDIIDFRPSLYMVMKS
jgi:hypothetical protein